MVPVRGGAGTGLAGVVSTGSSSSRPKTFSQAAMADCSTAYFVEKSRTGTKKRLMYSMNATSVPKPTAPATDDVAETGSPTTRCAPYQRIAAVEIALTHSTIENSDAS